MARMKAALNILDGAEAPADVGAHLDLAVCRLEAAIAQIEREGGDDVAVTAPGAPEAGSAAARARSMSSDGICPQRDQRTAFH